MVEKHAGALRRSPGCIPADVADLAFVARNRSNYVKAEGCADCRFHHVCDGLEQGYSQVHGTGELRPVAGERVTDPLEFRAGFYDGHERHLAKPKPEAPAIDVHARPDAVRTVSVVIPTYNRSAILGRCLEALGGQALDAELEVLVVDDGSTDETERTVAGFDGRLPVRLLRQEHAGPAAARNLGIREASGELIVIINDDTIPDEGFLAGHLRAHRFFGPDDRVAVLGARRFPPDAARRVMNFLFEGVPLYSPLHAEERGWRGYKRFITFSLSAPRRSFHRFGLFDEGFPTALVEDFELGWRWERAGCRVFFEPAIRAAHDHLMTVDGWDGHITRLYQNRRIMFERHPLARPKRYFMDVEPEQMAAFVAHGAGVHGTLPRGAAGRSRARTSTRWRVTRSWAGRSRGRTTSWTLVKQIVPDYKRYRSFAHRLEHGGEGRGEAVA